MYEVFDNKQYNYQASLKKFYNLLNRNLGFHGDILLDVNSKLDVIEPLLKNMFANNTAEENINLIYTLTYYPNLIGLALNVLIRDKDVIASKTSIYRHPILNELMHQSDILYRSGSNCSNNNAYNSVRARLEIFLEELKKSAPEYFAHRDAYDLIPLERLSNESQAKLISVMTVLPTPEKTSVCVSPEMQTDQFALSLTVQKVSYLYLTTELQTFAESLEEKQKSNKDVNIAIAARTLHTELDSAKSFFDNPTPQNFAVFQKQCQASMKKAERAFQQHRDLWDTIHPIFKGILGVIAALTIIPALVVEAFTTQGYWSIFFTTPETESAEKLTRFKNQYEQLEMEIEEHVLSFQSGPKN